MSNSALKIKPLADNLLIQPIEKETKLPSGIVIPDSAKEKPQEGKIVAIGSGRRDTDGNRIPFEVKVGDKVMYKQWKVTEVKIEGVVYLLAKEEDILALIEK